MVAVGKGFIDIVTMLHVCPLIEINHQDNDGNTALMIAAQAGWYAGGSASSPTSPTHTRTVDNTAQHYNVNFSRQVSLLF